MIIKTDFIRLYEELSEFNTERSAEATKNIELSWDETKQLKNIYDCAISNVAEDYIDKVLSEALVEAIDGEEVVVTLADTPENSDEVTKAIIKDAVSSVVAGAAVVNSEILEPALSKIGKSVGSGLVINTLFGKTATLAGTLAKLGTWSGFIDLGLQGVLLHLGIKAITSRKFNESLKSLILKFSTWVTLKRRKASGVALETCEEEIKETVAELLGKEAGPSIIQKLKQSYSEYKSQLNGETTVAI